MRNISIGLSLVAALAAPGFAAAQATGGEDSQHILTVDHYVPNVSSVPAIAAVTAHIPRPFTPISSRSGAQAPQGWVARSDKALPRELARH